MKVHTYIYTLITFLLLSCACSSNNDTEDNQTTNFKVDELLEDALNTNILPSVNNFVNEAIALDNSITNFVENVNEENLIEAQNQWKSTVLSFSDLEPFNFGDVRNTFVNVNIYNWPTLPSAIENIINDNDIVNEDLLLRFSSEVKSLAAIEYLLFSADNTELVSIFSMSEKRRNYLKVSMNSTLIQSNRLMTTWGEPTNYSETFLDNTGTGIRSSFNLFYNGINNTIDIVKIAKVGKPAGLENSEIKDPELSQAFYSNTSLTIIRRNILSIKNVFFKENGLGIADYIFSITKNNDLNNTVETKIDEILIAIDVIPTSLFEAITNNHNDVEDLYNKLEELSILFTVDVKSVLSVIITTTDVDGD